MNEGLLKDLASWVVDLLRGEGNTFFNGFIIGVIFVFVYIFCYKVSNLFIGKKSLKGLWVKNSSGKFYVTCDAIKNLIVEALAPVQAIEFHSITLFKERRKIIVKLSVNIQMLNNIDALRYHLEQQVLKILAENFSMRHGVYANIVVRKVIVPEESKKLKTPIVDLEPSVEDLNLSSKTK